MRFAIPITLIAASLCFAATVTLDFESFPGADGSFGTADDIPATCGARLDTKYSAFGIAFTNDTHLTNVWAVPNISGYHIYGNGFGTFGIPVYGIEKDAATAFGLVALTIFDAGGHVLGGDIPSPRP